SLGQVEEMTRTQEEGFQRLDVALEENGQRVGEALDGLTEVVAEMRDSMRDLSQQVAEVLVHLRGSDNSSETQSSVLSTQNSVLPPSGLPNLTAPEERLLPILRTSLPQDDLHLSPDIPPRKLAGACRSCQVPADETIFALVEATVTGTGRCSLLLGRVGL